LQSPNPQQFAVASNKISDDPEITIFICNNYAMALGGGKPRPYKHKHAAKIKILAASQYIIIQFAGL